MSGAGEYTAGRGTPARKHDGSSKDLSPREQARVARITAQRTGVKPGTVAETAAYKEASLLTNKYSEEVDSGEEV